MYNGIDNLEDHMSNLAGEFLVFKAVVSDPEINHSLVVAKMSCSSINPQRLSQVMNAIINGLAVYDVDVISFCGDGASENVSFFEGVSNISLKESLSVQTRDLFHSKDLEDMLSFNIAMLNPLKCNGDFIFFIEDMPHVIKRIVNALDRSSNSSETRNLKYGYRCMNLNLIQNIWKRTGGNLNTLSFTKLSTKHFEKDNFSRMRVYLAVQVLSGSVVKLINMACQDKNIKLQFDREYYEPIIDLATHVNNLVDIINGRYECFNKENGEEVIKSLLEILKWFDDWKKHNDNDESDNLDETNFLPKETWKGLRRMILGYIGMIDHYCLKHGLTIHPKRTLSDVCEHLFSKIRRTGGATSHPTCNIAHAAVHRDALTQQGRENSRNIRGSNCQFDDSHQRGEKKRVIVQGISDMKRRKRY